MCRRPARVYSAWCTGASRRTSRPLPLWVETPPRSQHSHSSPTWPRPSFGSIFERFLPVSGNQTRSFVRRAYVMCVTFALIASVVYIASGLAHRFIPSSIVWRAFFVVSVVMWTIFILQDSALVGLRSSRWVPVENIGYAVLKLALLPVMVALVAREGIVVSWSAPVALAIAGVTWYLFAKRIPEHETLGGPSESLPTTRELILLAGAQYATLLFGVFTPAIVSLIVIDRLGAVANAHYYVPALISGGLVLAMVSILKSFLVEATFEPHALRHHSNVTIGAMASLLVPGILIGEIFAPGLLRIFGSQYAAEGTTLLRLLLLSVPMIAISMLYGTFAWLDKRVWPMAIRDAASSAIYFIVVLALIGHLGIVSVGIASLVSSSVLGAVFLPILIRRYRLTTNSSDPKTAPGPLPE